MRARTTAHKPQLRPPNIKLRTGFPNEPPDIMAEKRKSAEPDTQRRSQAALQR
jgi:hypothetical protein